jgi:hypothetical protein
MKRLLFTSLILIGFAVSSNSQELLMGQNVRFFASDNEKTFWEHGQNDVFQLFLAVEPEQFSSLKSWNLLVEELDHIASKKEDKLKLLRSVFQKTHQRLFKKYELHSSFNAMLNEGKYDCVSGSAALGLLLNRFGFPFEIIETDYHVFVVTNLDGKKIILESTLPVGGMITAPSEVEAYLATYKANDDTPLKKANQSLAGPQIDYSDNSIFRKVSLRELAGLQYYNDAIVHFNSQDFGRAVTQLHKAFLLYPSERIDMLKELSFDLANKTYGYDLRK